MRQETIYGVTRKQAVDAMPWAAVVVKVDGGYMGFESLNDLQVWRKQK